MSRLTTMAVAFGSGFATLSFFGVAAFGQQVGSMAPPLKVARWIKGAPLSSLAPGKVYVIDFWATWSASSKKSIPHLNKLAAEYKDKVIVIGVNTREDSRSEKTGSSAYFSTVEKFVNGLGASMDYRVAVDDPRGTMARTWLKAAGQDSIPTTFVVGKDGKVAWIGHPMDVREALEATLQGQNSAGIAKQAAKPRSSQFDEDVSNERKAKSLIAERKFDEAFAIYDKLDKELDPMYKGMYGLSKFEALVKVNEPAAYALARKMIPGEMKTWTNGLEHLSIYIMENKNLKHRDYDVALMALRQIVVATEGKDTRAYIILAAAQHKIGKSAEAVSTLDKALAIYAKREKTSSNQQIVEGIKYWQDEYRRSIK